MKPWTIVATWEMSFSGVAKAAECLKNTGDISQAIINCINDVENNCECRSVGYGALPNCEGIVECDAAYMDGDTFAFGGVAGTHNIKNAVDVAKMLSQETVNNFLVGYGADKYAVLHGAEMCNMLTTDAKSIYEDKLKSLSSEAEKPYDGHDTIGAIGFYDKHIIAATSTSGLFMKRPGRVGDSPFPGAGLYADSLTGAAVATGLGEDLMKGCLTVKMTEALKTQLNPQSIADEILFDFHHKLLKRYGTAREMSVVMVNAKGQWAAATNVDFTFVVGDQNGIKVFDAKPDAAFKKTLISLHKPPCYHN